MIARCLCSIVDSIDGVNSELILVDNNDAPVMEPLATRSRAKYVHESQAGIAFARNAAMRASKAEFLLFTDDDCVVSHDWARSIVQGLLAEPQLTALGGVAATPLDSTFFQKSIGLFLGDVREPYRTGLAAASRLDSCNVGYRRNVLEKIGGFDTTFARSVEIELDIRLYGSGYKLAFDPAIVVYHERRHSLEEFLRQFLNWGYYNFRVFQKYPSLVIRTRKIIAPSMGLCAVCAGVLTVLLSSQVPPFILALLVLTGLAWLTATAVLTNREKATYVPFGVLMLLLRAGVEAVGFYKGVLDCAKSAMVVRVRRRSSI